MRPLEASDPRQIGHYRMLAQLGRGGMGRVLLGSGPDGRLAAVKLVDEQFVHDDQFRGRFRREVRASRRVAGAYTAAVIDADPEAAEPWLASVYVPGPSLHEIVAATGPLAAGPALRLAAGLAAALTEVHRAGLVHRDLKPSNVLLTEDGLRVIDFGIARAAEGEDGTQLTHTGALVGTPGFMSPEQALGRDLTTASDVFALGSTLVYACTGRGPFHAGSTPQTLQNVIHADPVLGDLPDRIREIVPACLVKDPAARPEPAALLRWIGEVPPSARPWPDPVHEAIARQDAQVARLLQAPAPQFPPAPAPTSTPTAVAPAPDRRRFLLMAGGGAALGLAALGGTAAWALRGDGEPASGRTSVSGGSGGTDSKPLAVLEGHAGSVYHAEFNGSGDLLVTAGEDGTVRLWDAKTGRPSGPPLKIASKSALRARFDRAGRLLLTAGMDGGVKVWDVRTRRQIGATLGIPMFDFSDDPAPVSDVAFSPAGDRLAAMGSHLKVWDTDSRKEVSGLTFDKANIMSLIAFSGDGRLLAFTSERLVRLWDVDSRKEVGQPLRGHTGQITSAAMSPDGRTLATGSADMTVRLWEVQRAAPLGEMVPASDHGPQGIAFSQDGRLLATVGNDTTARLWDVAGRKEVGKPIGLPDRASAVAFSPDGRVLAVGGDEKVWLYDVAGRTRA
ncbi:WD40 repeat domain-containing serine/threonine protein kinase [Actinomadura mexicana]|uniref:WD40-like Beta Propeller Repeat n=1 Tax=Actinomadura mexicana TaxID=134959 RepID=A0A238UU46_9ACTN|nr:serine/threonine-protein kinase [Actinomadura mexicana]SNR25662.1 WD40-like Beta Propeller Repeat [Actinomadura mexicana]